VVDLVAAAQQKVTAALVYLDRDIMVMLVLVIIMIAVAVVDLAVMVETLTHIPQAHVFILLSLAHQNLMLLEVQVLCITILEMKNIQHVALVA